MSGSDRIRLWAERGEAFIVTRAPRFPASLSSAISQHSKRNPQVNWTNYITPDMFVYYAWVRHKLVNAPDEHAHIQMTRTCS